jgi:hypothetical protein
MPATVQVDPAGMLRVRCTRFSMVAGMAPLSPITKSKCSGVSAIFKTELNKKWLYLRQPSPRSATSFQTIPHARGGHNKG